MKARSAPGKGDVNVLSIRPFRRLWIATSLSSLGDWLSLLALSTLVTSLGGSTTTQFAAVSGVWLASLLPALLLGPLAGAVADRMDRRLNMIIGDVLRALLYLSIPADLAIGFANKLAWVYTIQFLASCVALFWTPAKDATVPNLVPPDKLEQANGYSLFTTYGMALPAGLVFTLLSVVAQALGPRSQLISQVNLALYVNATTFAVSALAVFSLRMIARRQDGERISAPAVARTIWEGWRFVGQTGVVRGIVIGMVGAFAAGGVVLGLGPAYIQNTLHGGGAGWGVVFAAIFLGLAAGMFLGLRILRGFSRRRLFGLSIVGAGVVLVLIGLLPSLVAVAVLVVALGAFAGMAYVTGYTIVGREVDDDTRGRTFAFLQSGIRVILFLVVVITPLISTGFTAAITAVTGHKDVMVGRLSYASAGSNAVLLLSAGVAIWLGVISYRHMDDRAGVPLRADLIAAIRRPAPPVPAPRPGPVPAPRRDPAPVPGPDGLLPVLAQPDGEQAASSRLSGAAGGPRPPGHNLQAAATALAAASRFQAAGMPGRSK